MDLKQGVVTIDRASCYGVVSTTKTGRERVLPIDPRLVPMLKERLDQLQGDEALVCVDHRLDFRGLYQGTKAIGATGSSM